jgi:hypothetical protein
MAHCEGGYTTNLAVDDLVGGKGAVVTRYTNSPIEPVHGGPARLFVPHLYFWKSAKWLRRLSFTESNKPDFWESAGHHIRADPWKEKKRGTTVTDGRTGSARRLEWQLAQVRDIVVETPRVETFLMDVASWKGQSARTARRYSPDGRGRRSTAAQLLDRFASGRRADCSYRRASTTARSLRICMVSFAAVISLNCVVRSEVILFGRPRWECLCSSLAEGAELHLSRRCCGTATGEMTTALRCYLRF